MTRTNNTTGTTSTRIATANNALGIREYDLVKTAGKGICIALRKKSLNDELVLYSMSSATGRHRNDDDGMAKVRRYNADGKIATTSETTGKKLRNRDKYAIVGIASYANPVLAMKDFINQNASIEFTPIVVATNTPVDAAPSCMCDAFEEIIALLRDMNAKLDNI